MIGQPEISVNDRLEALAEVAKPEARSPKEREAEIRAFSDGSSLGFEGTNVAEINARILENNREVRQARLDRSGWSRVRSADDSLILGRHPDWNARNGGRQPLEPEDPS